MALLKTFYNSSITNNRSLHVELLVICACVILCIPRD